MPLIFYAIVFVGSIVMLVLLYRGPFYVPTKQKYVPRVIALLDLKQGERAVDLGSGDGRLVIALAKACAEAHGYEHNPLLVMRSRQLLRKHGLEGKAFVHMENFWDINASSFDGVVIFGIPYIMARLETKLRKELKPGARVVSLSFSFPNWELSAKESGVYLYRK